MGITMTNPKSETLECFECRGTGEDAHGECVLCDGTGRLTERFMGTFALVLGLLCADALEPEQEGREDE